MNIHFPGVKGLDIPTGWVFPKIVVCMNCGTAQFAIPDGDGKRLPREIIAVGLGMRLSRDYAGQLQWRPTVHGRHSS